MKKIYCDDCNEELLYPRREFRDTSIWLHIEIILNKQQDLYKKCFFNRVNESVERMKEG
jgi:hypothetical protein